MPETPRFRKTEKDTSNKEAGGGIFSRVRQKVRQAFEGIKSLRPSRKPESDKRLERQEQLNAYRDKVYFPPSATIQIDATVGQVATSEQSPLMADITLSSGEILRIRWNFQTRQFQYSLQTRSGDTQGEVVSEKPISAGGCVLRLRANQTLQIKSIHGGICSFNQRLCHAQDAYSRPNDFNQLPSQSREELALQRLSRNPRFSSEDNDSPYGYLDRLPIRGNLSERLAGGVYVGSQKAREAIYIPKISEQTPALHHLYQQVLSRCTQRGDSFPQFILQDVVDIVRSQVSSQPNTDSARVAAWIEANRLMDDGLINLDNFAQYRIGSTTHLALITALVLETLIGRNVIAGRVRVQETYQPGVGAHASITYTTDTYEVQLDPSVSYIGRRTAFSNGWNYDVTFRLSRQERKALEKTCKAAKLPQRQQDAHHSHEKAWRKHDKLQAQQAEQKRPVNELEEPLRSKVALSLRKVPVWIVDKIDLVAPTSTDTYWNLPISSLAYVKFHSNQGKLELRCNDEKLNRLSQDDIDQVICHETGGHILGELIRLRLPHERKVISREKENFGRANYQLLMKDEYSRNILTGKDRNYEAFLSDPDTVGVDLVARPKEELRLHFAIEEFFANRMSEYLQTVAGVEYHRTFFLREKRFTEEENRKCWQFCSMIYQSGEKLVTKLSAYSKNVDIGPLF